MLLVVLAMVCAALNTPQAATAEDLDQTLTSAHFRFEMSGAENFDGRRLVSQLEALWMFYERVMGSFVELNQEPERVRLLDFSGQQRLNSFLRERSDLEKFFPGLPRSLQRGYVAYDSATLLGSSDRAVLFHAVVHLLNSQLLYQEGVVGSWWTREGLAVYFMQTPLDREGRFRYGKVRTSEGFITDTTASRRTADALAFALEPKGNLKKIRTLFKKNRQIPLEELLKHRADEPWPDAEIRDRASVEAWILLHFLMHGRDGGLKPRLGRFLEVERRGNGGEAMFRKTVSGDLGIFEQLMYAYIKKML